MTSSNVDVNTDVVTSLIDTRIHSYTNNLVACNCLWQFVETPGPYFQIYTGYMYLLLNLFHTNFT